MIPDGQQGHYGLILQAYRNQALKDEFDLEIAYRRDACIKAIKGKDWQEAELHSDMAIALEAFWERLGHMAKEAEQDNSSEPDEGTGELSD
jgi:hypothetical protein